jgi:preprotein translocase subunit SecG
MIQLIFIIHVLAAIFLIALVLMQQGKGADMGAAFGGGASQTIFGSVGNVPFLVKVTALIATIFFVSSLGLGYVISQQVKQQNTTAINAPINAPTVPAPDVPQK